MKTFLLLIAMLASWTIQAREFHFNIQATKSFYGREFDLKEMIERRDRHIDLHDFKVTQVHVRAQSLTGRDGDFRNPTAGAYFRVRGNGGCGNARGSNELKFSRRNIETKVFSNPNRNDISDGEWVVGVCDNMDVFNISVFIERRQGGGTRPTPPAPPAPQPGDDFLPAIKAKAGWTPEWTIEQMYEDAHTIIISNPKFNDQKIQIDELHIEIETRAGRDSMWLDLSHLFGKELYPGDFIEIKLPQSRIGDNIRQILTVELLLESWKSSGEYAIVEFDSTTRPRVNRPPRQPVGGSGAWVRVRRDNDRPGTRIRIPRRRHN